MTVADLIEALGQFPPHARVVTPHFYSGFNDVMTVCSEPIRRAPDADLSMAHARYEGANMFDEAPFVPDETAVVIDTSPRIEGSR
ncbi:hypothetical protein [Caballeronia grimmiae]|uniref:hypothetical protein n=1 Tax=Caballeronia grimmiae TaxID=1071679 RepID=UPI0038B82278